MSQALTPLRLNIRARQKRLSLGHIDSHVSAVPHLIAAYVRVRTIPSVASLEACEPRTSNGRVLVRRMGQRSNPVENGPVLRHQQLPRPDRSVTSMHFSGIRVR